MRLRWSPLFIVVALVWFPGTSSADWPQARHDPQRTAQASGSTDIQTPVVYWKRYIGGNLEADSMLLTDLDGDGASEVLMLIGGSVVAKGRADTERWRSPNLALDAFIGLADLDGVAGDELVARSEDRVYVIDPRTGAVIWGEPAGEIGTIGGTRLGDVDGDNLPDLIVQECGCCRVVGTNPGFAYSFAGAAATPQQLWAIPVARCGGHQALTLVDPDGTAPADVLVGDLHELALLDGRTGAELARTASLGNRLQESRCVPVNLDGAPGEELVCVRDARMTPTERGVFALRYNGTAVLEVMWSTPIAAIDGGAIQWVELVADLDGAGAPEVVVSGSLDGTAWDTYVLRGATGQIDATITGEVVAGVAPTTTGGTLLTASDLQLSGWRYSPGGVTGAWSVLDAVVPKTLDLTREARSAVSVRATVAKVDDDDLLDVITTLRSQPGTMVGYNVAGGTAAQVGQFALPPNVETLRMWPLAAIDADLHLAVADNDGFLTLFDRHLVPARIPGEEIGQAHLRTGGYYAPGFQRVDNTLRSARLDVDAERILLVDSRGSMIVLDAELGSFAAPPAKLWELYGGDAPAVVDGLDNGEPGVACIAEDQPRTTPPTYSIVALGRAGSTLWRVPAPSTPVNDIVAGRLDGDSAPDLVFQWGDPGDVLLQTRAVSGFDGATLWDAVPVDPGAGRKPRGVALAAFDGDGLDDVYHQASRTQVLSGATGGELATSAAGSPYALPTLTNLDGDPRVEVVLHGGPQPVTVLDQNLNTTVLASPDDNRPFPYGALADCGGGRQVLVEGSELNPARLKVTDLSGPTLGQETTVVLAGGALFPDEASAAATTGFLGQLTSATVHQDLVGMGRPSAVVGSSDGWLYAFDPCVDSLDFSVAFGAAVGEAIFGDTDGDGRDEILVTVQDGYLYELRNFELEAPGLVNDTDPFTDAPGDINQLTTEDTLEATWPAVDGALRYTVSVVDANGAYVGTPWQDAGTATTFRLTGLPLVDGFYRVAVRAHRVDGHYSVDTVSDGLLVVVGPPPDGVDDGCDCRTASPQGSVLLVLVTAGLLRRRRRVPAS